MGNILSNCPCRRHRVASEKEITLLMVGLDNAGKTCTAKHLLGESAVDAVPTVGFTSIQLRHGKFNVCVYDIGGGPKIRGIWKKYYALVHGVIFVVDASDTERLEECKNEIANVIKDERIAGKPILLLFNKQDLDNAVNETELVNLLELEALVNHQQCPTRVEGSCALFEVQKTKDPGIQEGFSWLIGHIGKEFEILRERVEKEKSEQMKQEEKDRAERMERVRKIRDEREKEKMRQEQEGVVDLEPNGCCVDDDDDVIIGNPFKPAHVIKVELQQREIQKKGSVPHHSGVKVIHVSPTHGCTQKDDEVVLQPQLSYSTPSLISRSNHTNNPSICNAQSSFLPFNDDDLREKSRFRKPKKRFKNKIVPQVSDSISLIQSSTGDLPPLKSAAEMLNGNVAVYTSPRRKNMPVNGQVNWGLIAEMPHSMPYSSTNEQQADL